MIVPRNGVEALAGDAGTVKYVVPLGTKAAWVGYYAIEK